MHGLNTRCYMLLTDQCSCLRILLHIFFKISVLILPYQVTLQPRLGWCMLMWIFNFQVYNILKDVSPRILEALFKRKNAIFLNSLLVTPNRHRVREIGLREIGLKITVVSYSDFFFFFLTALFMFADYIISCSWLTNV